MIRPISELRSLVRASTEKNAPSRRERIDVNVLTTVRTARFDCWF